ETGAAEAAGLSHAAARARLLWYLAGAVASTDRSAALPLVLGALRESPATALARPALGALAALLLPRVPERALRRLSLGAGALPAPRSADFLRPIGAANRVVQHHRLARRRRPQPRRPAVHEHAVPEEHLALARAELFARIVGGDVLDVRLVGAGERIVGRPQVGLGIVGKAGKERRPVRTGVDDQRPAVGGNVLARDPGAD